MISEEPDIVLIPGDFWQLPENDISQPDKRAEFAAAMAVLDEGMEHVVAVNGNTDSAGVLLEVTIDTDVVVLDDSGTRLRSLRFPAISLRVDWATSTISQSTSQPA